MVSEVEGIARRAAVSNALRIDAGVPLDEAEGDAQGLTSNTDAKVTVYSTIDGEPREILRIDAERVLGKRRSDGTPAFWMPGLPGDRPPYFQGFIKCMLHPEFDESD